MRSNQAGEFGAVKIYEGALFALNWLAPLLRLSPAGLQRARAFAAEHLATEQAHLAAMDVVVQPSERTRLLPLWTVAGFTLGAVPLLVGGERAFYRTIEHVETFVEAHYQEQLEFLRAECTMQGGAWLADADLALVLELVALLELACADEVYHRNEARLLSGGESFTPANRLWGFVIGSGSATAVRASKLV